MLSLKNKYPYVTKYLKHITLHQKSLYHKSYISKATMSTSQSEFHINGIQVETKDQIRTIWLDNLAKRNAMTKEMYIGVTDVINRSAKDETILLCVLRGKGDIFCSGTDLKNIDTHDNSTLKNYVESFINFPKPMVAVVNGNAIGIGTTILGLCDVVFAVETATFITPFSNLGLCPEGCSSYTFPRLMGKRKANELLMLGKKINAIEAKNSYNLVTEVFKTDSFDKEVEKQIFDMTKLSDLSLCFSKELLQGAEKYLLLQTNKKEIEMVTKCKNSDFFKNALEAFMQRKKK